MAELRADKEAAAAAAAAASEEKAEEDREMEAMFEAAAEVAASDVSSPLGSRRGLFGVGGDRAVALALAEDEADSSTACGEPGSSTLDATEADRQASSESVSAGGAGEVRGGSLVGVHGILRRGSEKAIEHAFHRVEPWTAVGGGAVQVGGVAMWQMSEQAEIHMSADALLVRAAKRLWRPPPSRAAGVVAKPCCRHRHLRAAAVAGRDAYQGQRAA